MCLTDYREQCLKDVITQLEPGLFKKVTGLSVKDFEPLVSPGVFRDSVMNDAVYKFRLYEDALLERTGLNRHEYDSSVGLFDMTLSAQDYAQMKLRDSLLNPDGTTRDRNNAMVVASEIADARFEFSLRGSKASGGRSAWWLRGLPRDDSSRVDRAPGRHAGEARRSGAGRHRLPQSLRLRRGGGH